MRRILFALVLIASPVLAATPDRTAMNEWFRVNEACRGDGIASACRARDRLQAALERRGWCWAYQDINVMPYEYRWHRCERIDANARKN